MGETMAGTNEFAFFRSRNTCMGGGGQNQSEKKIKKCLPAGTKIYFSSFLDFWILFSAVSALRSFVVCRCARLFCLPSAAMRAGSAA